MQTCKKYCGPVCIVSILFLNTFTAFITDNHWVPVFLFSGTCYKNTEFVKRLPNFMFYFEQLWSSR